ncbi:hypothetical protein LEM8419_03260 [Neolewinella maritima]|uniref:TonB C-terminal domain-containing protein n=1 Tax=Neolewinella maritima TaxID=1383882 RepID=A0ABM9B4Y5_9BACT|nr:carboxypeptidase-like regulatory domain-containing protein [Neolewinella maritima]CAH1002353.1 hypothetical protein LEM8419_03260 [Neolewinella maritima]
MPTDDTRSDYLLRRWISGALTAPEEAELERRATTEPGLQDALDGLRTAPEADHQARITRMLERAESGVRTSRRSISRYTTFAIAASIAMLLGVSVWLLPDYFAAEAEAEIAMDRRAPVTPAPALPAREEASPSSAPVAAESEPEPEPEPEQPATYAERAPEREEREEIMEDAAAAAPAAAPPTRSVRPLSVPPPRAAAPSSTIVLTPPVIGEVTDEYGTPIAGAEVLRIGQALGTRTDSNGVFQLTQDQALDQLLVRAAGYEDETVQVFDADERLQISLSPVASRARADVFAQNSARTEVGIEPLREEQSRALPVEGYRELRQRIEAERPQTVPAGKVRVSFLVQPDGELTDFRFRGQPDRATMDYVGTALVESSTWRVVPTTKRPVRVYFTLRFD